MLPWLHTKFVVLLAAAVVALTVRLWKRWPSLIGLMVPIAASVSAWLAFFHVIYGTFDPQAPYGPSLTDVSLSNIPRSLVGLLVDQKFGLLRVRPDLRDRGQQASGSCCVNRSGGRWRSPAQRSRASTPRAPAGHVHVVGRFQRTGTISGARRTACARRSWQPGYLGCARRRRRQ